MIQISDLKALVQSEMYQTLAQQLTEKYLLNVVEETLLQGWNIYCELLNDSGLSLAEIFDYFVKNVEIIGILLSEREKKIAEGSSFPDAIFLLVSTNLILLEDKNRLLAYFKKIGMPTPNKAVKEFGQEFQTALAIFNGEEPPKEALKTQKATKKSLKKVKLGVLSYDKETNGQTATATIWGKPMQIFLDAKTQEIPMKDIENWLNWVEENRREITCFALDAEGFVDNFNTWVEKEIAKKGKAKLFDGTILTKVVSAQTIAQSLSISSIGVELEDKVVQGLMIDLITTPDYFGGHALNIEIDRHKKMFFGGMNG